MELGTFVGLGIGNCFWGNLELGIWNWGCFERSTERQPVLTAGRGGSDRLSAHRLMRLFTELGIRYLELGLF